MKLHPYAVVLDDGRNIERRAWSGGCSCGYPRSHPLYGVWLDMSAAMLAEQVDMWRAYWHDDPNVDTLGIFWGRAKADAYVTISAADWDGFRFEETRDEQEG